MTATALPAHHYSRWTDALDRHDAWWKAGRPRRPLARLGVAGADPGNVPKWDRWCFTREPEKAKEHVALYASLAALGSHRMDSFPVLSPSFGPGIPAALIHNYLDVHTDTVWFEKSCSWKELETIRFSEDHPWWRRMEAAMRAGLDAGFIMSTPDLGGVVDVCASVRGTNELLMDLADDPERVRDLIARVRALWFECFDRFYAMTRALYGGIANRWGFFARGRHYPLQCDFAAMLSPKMFETFILPSLIEECKRLDYAVYHLDGVNQIAHLDMILSIPNMRLIQWVPGAGKPGLSDPQWFPMYRKIQAAGRGLVLGGGIADLERYLRELDPALLHLTVSAKSDAEADRAEELLEKAGG